MELAWAHSSQADCQRMSAPRTLFSWSICSNWATVRSRWYRRPALVLAGTNFQAGFLKKHLALGATPQASALTLTIQLSTCTFASISLATESGKSTICMHGSPRSELIQQATCACMGPAGQAHTAWSVLTAAARWFGLARRSVTVSRCLWCLPRLYWLVRYDRLYNMLASCMDVLQRSRSVGMRAASLAARSPVLHNATLVQSKRSI